MEICIISLNYWVTIPLQCFPCLFASTTASTASFFFRSVPWLYLSQLQSHSIFIRVSGRTRTNRIPIWDRMDGWADGRGAVGIEGWQHSINRLCFYSTNNLISLQLHNSQSTGSQSMDIHSPKSVLRRHWINGRNWNINKNRVHRLRLGEKVNNCIRIS